MTRFFKVSLSVIALLLVSLLAFTGCSETADKALTAAEEAMQAVTAATADFEAAIANKADASKLADQVDALTKAIEDAEIVAKDGDSALKGAIAAAKVALTENTQAVVNALDIRIAELLAGKADSVVLDAELARFEKILGDINKATGAYLKLNDFVSFSTQAGVAAYKLEQNFKRMETLKEFYGDDWAKIEEAYTVAKVTIYRATSMGVIETARAQFDKVVSENPNAIDGFYYNYILKYEKGELPQYTAEGIYGDAKVLYENATDAEKAIIADYYGKGNLVLTALEMWREEFTAEMNDIGKLYIIGNADDCSLIAAAESASVRFGTAVSQCNTWFGNDSASALVKPAEYIFNSERIYTMAYAESAAQTIIDMGTNYDLNNFVFNQTNIDYIADWKEAYDEWKSIYLLELQASQMNDAVYMARYNQVKALIAPTEAPLTAAINKLKDSDEAKNFIKNLNNAEFVAYMKDNFYIGSALNLNSINILSAGAGGKITTLEIMERDWADALVAEGSTVKNGEITALPEFVYANASDVRVDVVRAKVDEIRDYYDNKITEFTNDVYLPYKNAIADVFAVEHLDMYDTSAKAFLDAFRGLEWGNVTSITLSNNVLFQKSEFDKLVALETERLGFIDGAKAHFDKITTAYNELKATQTKDDFDEAKTELDELVNKYKDGSYAEAGLEVYCAYDETKPLVNIALGIALPADIDAAVEVQRCYLLLKEFNDKPIGEINDRLAYETAKTNLETALATYTGIQGYDEAFAAKAQGCINTAAERLG